uniref:short-chain dehydrogenase n=1 Tax=Promineifilum sp. TaxID=2664178 RepID=UPI0035B4676A
MNADRCILVLGGAGLVGAQIVREIARELEPERIVVASLYRGEVREFLHDARREFCNVEFVGAWGDVFVRDEFMLESRRRLTQSPLRRDHLYQDLFGPLDEAYTRSGLAQLIRQYRPNVVVDCINTATAISYQDVDSLSKQTHDLLGQLAQIVDHQDLAALDALGRDLEQNVSTLLISQSLPQLIRHVQVIHRAMSECGTRLYLKIGTTGTGGMGLNIPYTHSEDRPSFKLMSKTAVAFAHTGLMFLMARTPDGPLVKELKPAAMIGYRRVAYKSVKLRGRPQMRYQSQEQPLGDRLLLRGDENQYERLDKLQMAGVDTGENGFFARGEFETITHTDQMEFITPEEIAAQAVLEIKGSNTGYDVIGGIDSSLLNPSYRAGVLRQTALDKMARIEEETGTHSVALGQLGPPELSKLLYEAHLLKLNYGTLDNVLAASPGEIAETLYDCLLHEDYLRTTITSIGVPILAPDGERLLRGPRLNIPESIYREVDVDRLKLNAWAAKGWVDLRPANFRLWQERFERMQRTKHMLHTRGTSSVTIKTYLPEAIEIGAVVAWIFNNEAGGYRIK